MQLTTPAFEPNGTIPDRFTCKGEDTNPPLTVQGVPSGTQSLALIMHDPDAPSGDFIHWMMWNIPPDITIIDESAPPAGAVQGQNDFPKIGYGGPCPPSGTHRYVFTLYALDRRLDLPPTTSVAELRAQAKQAALATAELIGTVTA